MAIPAQRRRRLCRAPRAGRTSPKRACSARPRDYPVQQLIDRTLQRAGRREPPDLAFNYLETTIAMCEAGAGIAIVPSFTIASCLKHGVSIHPLIEPVVPVDFVQIVGRGRKLPAGAEEFNSFLKSYVAKWADAWTPALVRAA